MSSLASEVIDASFKLIDLNRQATRAEMRAHAREVFRDRLMLEVGETAIDNWLGKVIADGMRRALPSQAAAKQATFNDVLPGFPVPAVMTAEESPDGDVTYVAFEFATWRECMAHQALQMQNLVRIQQNIDDFRDKLDVLRPYMEPYPWRPVRRAVHLISQGLPPETKDF